MSGNLAKRCNAPLFQQNKSFELSKSTHLEQKRERLHCSHSLHLSSATPSSCCAGLAARRGFLFWFLCWRSKFPGMWNQRRRCHVSPPSPFFLNPSQQSLWDSEQHISSSMRNGSELRAARRSHGVQIPRMMRRRAHVLQTLRYCSIQSGDWISYGRISFRGHSNAIDRWSPPFEL